MRSKLDLFALYDQSFKFIMTSSEGRIAATITATAKNRYRRIILA